MYGIDIHDFFLGKLPWAKFLRLAGWLREGTRFYDAKLRDDEAAELIVNSEGFTEPTGGELDFIGESREVEQLRTVVDLLQQLIFVTANNPSNRRPRPVNRPETALAKAMRKRNERQLDNVLESLGVDW